MGNQLREVESHVDAAFGLAERRAIVFHQQGQVQLAAVPGLAQLVRRHGDRRKGARRFGLEETETLGQLTRDQPAQRDIIDQHDEADGFGRLLDRTTGRRVPGDDGDLAFHVTAPGRVTQRDIGARREKGVGAALIHQRIGPESGRHFGIAGLADQFDVIDIGRAVSPLEGARQRRQGLALMETLARDGLALQLVRQRAQGRLAAFPIIQRRLQRRGNLTRVGTPGQIMGDHDKAAVAAI